MSELIFNDFLPSPAYTILDSGVLSGKAKIARVGIQYYVIDGEIAPVLRSESVVMDTMEFFNNLPVCIDHPINSEINPSNKEKLIKGWGSEVTYKDGWLQTTVNIFADDAIKAVQEKGYKQISNGYRGKYIKDEGTWIDSLGVMGAVGKEYAYRYKQIILGANHIAMVQAARAGSEATFVADSETPTGKIIVFIDGKNMKLKDTLGYLKKMADECGYKDMSEEDGMTYPSSVKDMMTKYMDMQKGKIKDSLFADNSEYVTIDSLKQSESRVKEMETVISLQNVKIADLEKTIADSQTSEDQLKTAMEQEIKYRMQCFNDASPYLENAQFEASKIGKEWLQEALSLKGVKTENMSDSQIESAFNTLKQVFPVEGIKDSKVLVSDTPASKRDEEYVKMRGSTETRQIKPSEVLPQYRAIKSFI